jgi:lipoate---protein ligase
VFQLDLTLPSPAENLALDEVLLDLCEEGNGGEVLRFWEPTTPFVVLGHSCRVAEDVDLDFCAEHGIPILRRRSGGGTVLQMPGCLNFALIMRITPQRGTIAATNAEIMGRQRAILAHLLGRTVSVEGHTDLTLDGKKFSGNAQRRRLRALMFHGSFLLHAELPLIAHALKMPQKQPYYRNNRGHEEFLTNIGATAQELKRGLVTAWEVEGDGIAIPREAVQRLVEERYGREEWTREK